MTEDFDVADVPPPNKSVEPSERKIGPFGQRSVSIYILFDYIELVAIELWRVLCLLVFLDV